VTHVALPWAPPRPECEGHSWMAGWKPGYSGLQPILPVPCLPSAPSTPQEGTVLTACGHSPPRMSGSAPLGGNAAATVKKQNRVGLRECTHQGRILTKQSILQAQRQTTLVSGFCLILVF
jgi:hypothetical protein